jgi:lysophospholipase L1-like esterase
MPGTAFGRGCARAIVISCAATAALLLPVASRATSDTSRIPTIASPSCPSPFALDAEFRLSRTAKKLSRGEPIRILAIGSSSTQGIGASGPDRTYPARLDADLKQRWPKADVSVMNAGIGGETVPATLDRLERLLRTQAFDLVIWQLGTNDAVHGDNTDTFRALTLRGIAAVREAGADLVLLDPQYYPGIKDVPAYERFVSIVKQIGDEQHVPVFDRYSMMKTWRADSESTLLATLAQDRFHMNDKGYACLAEALTAEIGQMSEPAPVVASPALTVSAKR